MAGTLICGISYDLHLTAGGQDVSTNDGSGIAGGGCFSLRNRSKG
jgi:hypothetical protein